MHLQFAEGYYSHLHSSPLRRLLLSLALATLALSLTTRTLAGAAYVQGNFTVNSGSSVAVTYPGAQCR